MHFYLVNNFSGRISARQNCGSVPQTHLVELQSPRGMADKLIPLRELSENDVNRMTVKEMRKWCTHEAKLPAKKTWKRNGIQAHILSIISQKEGGEVAGDEEAVRPGAANEDTMRQALESLRAFDETVALLDMEELFGSIGKRKQPWFQNGVEQVEKALGEMTFPMLGKELPLVDAVSIVIRRYPEIALPAAVAMLGHRFDGVQSKNAYQYFMNQILAPETGRNAADKRKNVSWNTLENKTEVEALFTAQQTSIKKSCEQEEQLKNYADLVCHLVAHYLYLRLNTVSRELGV